MGITAAQRDGVPIDSTGEVLRLPLHGADMVELSIRGTGEATYFIDIRKDSTNNWIEETYGYQFVTDVDDVLRTGAGEMRLRVSNAASAGSTATVYMGAV